LTAVGAKGGNSALWHRHRGLVLHVVAPSRHSGSAIERYLICDRTDTHPSRRSNGTPGDKADADRSYWWSEPRRTIGNANYIDSESFTRLWKRPNFGVPARPRKGEATRGAEIGRLLAVAGFIGNGGEKRALALVVSHPFRKKRGKDGARGICFRDGALFWGRGFVLGTGHLFQGG
jgi:hypothetical protein